MKILIFFLLMLLGVAAKSDTITFITMTGAGSFSDTTIRQVAPNITKHTGQQVAIINMPGADGQIALRHFLNSSDNTFLIGNSSIGYLESVDKLSTNLYVLTGLLSTDLAVYSNLPLQDLIIKKQLLAGTTSPMTSLTIDRVDSTYGTTSLRIGYKQFTQAVADLIAGRIDYLIAPIGSSSMEVALSTGKVFQVANMGNYFGWNAIFSKVDNPILSAQLELAVSETVFISKGVNRLTKQDVVRLQKEERLMLRRIGSSK